MTRLGPWLVGAEELLSENERLPIRSLETWAGGRLGSAEDVDVAIQGWASLGLVTREGRYLRVATNMLEETREYRRGICDAVTRSRPQAVSVQLCATFEPLVEGIRGLFERSFLDLRSVVSDVITSSTEDLVLASPFWDHESVSGLTDVIRRRLEAGVRVRILSRFGQEGTVPKEFVHLRRIYPSSFSVHSWIRAGRNGEDVTFHFKVATSDRGRKAYLGSANFTTSGFRTRLELGVLFTGHEAGVIHHAVETVLGDALEL